MDDDDNDKTNYFTPCACAWGDHVLFMFECNRVVKVLQIIVIFDKNEKRKESALILTHNLTVTPEILS